MAEPTTSSRNNVHLIYGIAFTVIALVALISLVILKSRADNSAASVTVTNSSPAVDSITFSASSYGTAETPFTPTEAVQTRYVHGFISDVNGCIEINSSGTTTMTHVKLFRSSATNGTNCTADSNDCFVLTNTQVDQCSGGGDTISRYQATAYGIPYWIDATDASSASYSAQSWVAWARVVDVNNGSGTADTAGDLEVATLTALDVASSASFGSVAIGGDSSEVIIQATNTSNEDFIDTQVSGTDFACPNNTSIQVGQVRYASTTGFAYANGVALTSGATTLNSNISQRTNDASVSSTPTYWILRVPSIGVAAGSCTSTITFAATGS